MGSFLLHLDLTVFSFPQAQEQENFYLQYFFRLLTHSFLFIRARRVRRESSGWVRFALSFDSDLEHTFSVTTQQWAASSVAGSSAESCTSCTVGGSWVTSSTSKASACIWASSVRRTLQAIVEETVRIALRILSSRCSSNDNCSGSGSMGQSSPQVVERSCHGWEKRKPASIPVTNLPSLASPTGSSFSGFKTQTGNQNKQPSIHSFLSKCHL